MRLHAYIVAVLAALALIPAAAGAATLHATPSTFGSTWTAARGGDTILLASGSYASWSPTTKGDLVTLRPEDGAAVSVAGSEFGTAVRNITVRGVRYTAGVCIRPPSGVKMGLTLDGVTFGAVGESSCGEGRLSIRGGGTSAIDGNGVQIMNSTFGPGGCSDGIQDLSSGTEIGPGNEIRGIVQGGCAAHSDAIQPYASNFVHIHDNYLHDNEQGIMSPDGASTGYRIENNAIHTSTGYPCMHLGHVVNATVRHNACVNGSIRVYGGNENVASQNVTAQDNAADMWLPAGGCTGCTINHNQQVTYTGGAGRCGYATSSPKGTASDGTDIGLNDCAAGPPPPPPPPSDRDGDGVPDSADACPDVAGTQPDGCPPPTPPPTVCDQACVDTYKAAIAARDATIAARDITITTLNAQLADLQGLADARLATITELRGSLAQIHALSAP